VVMLEGGRRGTRILCVLCVCACACVYTCVCAYVCAFGYARPVCCVWVCECVCVCDIRMDAPEHTDTTCNFTRSYAWVFQLHSYGLC